MKKPEPPEQPGATEKLGDEEANRQIGGFMVIAVWILLIGLMTWFAHQYLTSSLMGDQPTIKLKANANGHYLATGLINGEEVVFLLDTGATSVSVPASVAARIGLQGEFPVEAQTANGTITVQATLLESVTLGGLTLQRVQGHINESMQGELVLLGMSFLRYFDLKTSNDLLTISKQP